MKLKKREINEIIDTNSNLIGSDNIPTNGADLETAANGTTDQNAKKGQQPFRYDMLGRFGFTLMPFMEGVDKHQGQAELENDLVDLLNERYVELLTYFYKNPEKVKSEYKKYSADKEICDEVMVDSVKCGDKILKILENHFGKAFNNLDEELKTLDEQFHENLVESKVVEDKMVDKKEDEMSKKSEDGEVREKKIEKIAGLINRLEKKDIDKLINLLEKKNG